MSDKIAQAEKLLRVLEATLRTNLGRDEKPSGLLVALEKYAGIDPDIIELVQDSGILSWRVLRTIRRNLDNPDAIGPALLVLVADVPEIVADIKRLKQ